MAACSDFRDLLGSLLDGELAAAEQRAVMQHLAACPQCRQELANVKQLAARLAAGRDPLDLPAGLWASIESALGSRRLVFSRLPRRPLAVAAVVLFAVGLGLVGLPWTHVGVAPAEAGAIDFSVLLNSVNLDPQRAFESFVKRYAGRPIDITAARQFAADLTFGLPDELPGGFRRQAIYAIRLGTRPGLAARYTRGDELLVAIFHPPVLQEHYGTHEDYACIVGQHRGHMTEIDGWRLVHVTDSTTCHCILSRLDAERELPPILAVLAPGMPPQPIANPADSHP